VIEVDLERPETAALEAQALIEEARRLHRRRQRRLATSLISAAVLVGVALGGIVVFSGGRSRPSTTVPPRVGIPAVSAKSTAYVTTSAGIVVVDLATKKFVGRIEPRGSNFALNPIAIAPGDHTAYVDSDNVLTAIDLPPGKVKASVTLGPPTGALADASGYPSSISITPDGQTAYVAIPVLGTIVPVHLAPLSVGTPISVGGHPFQIAIAPNGETAYIPNPSSSTIEVVNLATGSVGPPITGIADPHEIAIAPDGRRAYVSSGGINLPPSVVPIDLSAGRALAPIAFKSHVFGYVPGPIQVSLDGRTVFVPFARSIAGAQILVLNTATNQVIARLGQFSGPIGLTLVGHTGTLYVLNTAPSVGGRVAGMGRNAPVQSNALVPIDLAQERIEKPIPIPSPPRSVGIAQS
jgi:DNA-binding beta-propeller fold protein YncE